MVESVTRSEAPRFVVAFGWVLAGAVFAAGARIASRAEPPADARPATDAERADIGRAFVAREPAIRLATQRHFPGDRWSADDDFANVEQRAIRETAESRGIRTSDVVRAIDDALRAEPGVGRATASPCKPRPFYD